MNQIEYKYSKYKTKYLYQKNLYLEIFREQYGGLSPTQIQITNLFFYLTKSFKEKDYVMEYYNSIKENISLYKNDALPILYWIKKSIGNIIQTNKFENVEIEEFDSYPSYNRICIRTKEESCTNFRYVYLPNNTISEKDIENTKLELLMISEEIDKLINTIIYTRQEYVNFIILCLNFENLMTILLYKLNIMRGDDIIHESLFDSQKKIINNLEILLSDENVILMPINTIPGYSQFMKIGDIPLFLTSLSDQSEIAHGVMLYPLSFFFHDIQHAYEQYHKKKSIYSDMQLSNSNKIKLFNICNLYSSTNKKLIYYNDVFFNDIYEMNMRHKYSCFCKLFIFFYLHEESNNLNKSVSELIDIFCAPKLYSYYTNRFNIIEDKFTRAFVKEKQYDSVDKIINYDRMNKIYCEIGDGDQIDINLLRKKMNESITLISYLLENYNENQIKETRLSELILKSKEWLKINKKINVDDINGIVSNNLCDSIIIKIYNFDFYKYYSDTLLSYGYVKDRNVIELLSSLFTKTFSNKLFYSALEKIDNHNIFLLKIINDDNNTLKNKECILFLLESVYIPIYCKIILIYEILRIGNPGKIINTNTDIKPQLLKEKVPTMITFIESKRSIVAQKEL